MENKARNKADQPLASWDINMPLVGNPFFLYDLGKLFFFTYLVTAGISLFICALSGEMASFPFMLKIFFYIVAGSAMLSLLVSLFVFANRSGMRFTLTEKKVSWETRSQAGRMAGPLALIAGLLARKPALAGAGALALAGRSGNIAWTKIRGIKEYPMRRVISLKNSWRVVTRLFCTPENYDAVAEIVRGCANAAKKS